MQRFSLAIQNRKIGRVHGKQTVIFPDRGGGAIEATEAFGEADGRPTWDMQAQKDGAQKNEDAGLQGAASSLLLHWTFG